MLKSLVTSAKKCFLCAKMAYICKNVVPTAKMSYCFWAKNINTRLNVFGGRPAPTPRIKLRKEDQRELVPSRRVFDVGSCLTLNALLCAVLFDSVIDAEAGSDEHARTGGDFDTTRNVVESGRDIPNRNGER